MTKLHQLLAIEKSAKTDANRDSSALYKEMQRAEAFAGRHSTYRPFNEDDGDKQADKQQLVQLRAEEVLNGFSKCMTRILNITATRDTANQEAKADVIVSDVVLLKNVPVSTLIFLEKTLNDEETAVRKLPTLPTNVEWQWDDNSNLYATAPTKSYRAAKVDKVIIKAEATKEHPAQVEIRPADVQVGEWTTILYSGALPAKRKEEVLGRITELKEALKFAREMANRIDVKDVSVATPIYDYVINGQLSTQS